MKKESKNKLLIISLEGGSWKIFNKFIAHGKMPYLKSLKKNSLWGNLDTLLPTLVYPTWASFWTGETPEEHKIFGFKDLKGLGKISNVDSLKIDKKSFLAILSKKGVKVNSIFAPLTYPPYKISGQMVSEQHIIGTRENTTYPSALKKQILRNFNEIPFPKAKQYYPVEGLNSLQKIKKFINKQKESITDTCELASFMFENQSWDISLVHLFAIDPLLHSLWDEVVKLNTSKNVELNKQIDSFFHHLDKKIKSLVDLESSTSVLIFSTNGFTKTKKILNLANIIEELNLSKSWKEEKIILEFKSIHVYNKIKNKRAIIKSIIKKLENLKDSNKRIIKKAWLSDELYNKKINKNNNWSTIIIEFEEGYTGRNSYDKKEFLDKVSFPEDYLIGTHDNKSMWLFLDKKLKKKKEINAKIIDLPPTILNFFRIKKPKNMEGKVIN